MEVQNFSKFALRSNVLSKETYLGQTVIYEDHRTILTVLYSFKKELNLKFPIDIVMFDKHDDFMNPSPEALQKITKFHKKPSLEKLFSIVEFDLSGNDDDWVKAGMELGLIGNVFLFNAEVSQIDFMKEYLTQNFGLKKVYNLGPVWEVLDERGDLSDVFRKDNLESFWNDFGWVYKDGKFDFKEDRNPFILDIDLDCFSCYIYGDTVAIPSQILEQKLHESKSNTRHAYYDSVSFMKKIAKDSCVNTICFESVYCGGIRHAHQIFNNIDELIFDSQLGS